MASNDERGMVENIIRGLSAPVHMIELGAHHGHDTVWLKQAAESSGVQCKYMAVEPDARNVEVLNARALKGEFGQGLKFFPGAVCAHTGTTEFWPCEGNSEGSGSIRQPKEHLNHFPNCKFPRVIRVPCLTLDDLCRNYGYDHIDFIWSDIQGAERDLLTGGAHMLGRTKYLFSEFDDIEFYEGQANREEFMRLLPVGWEVVHVFEFNILLKNTDLTKG
jgi:FkbM family methyltransferase